MGREEGILHMYASEPENRELLSAMRKCEHIKGLMSVFDYLYSEESHRHDMKEIQKEAAEALRKGGTKNV